jgi:autotransporter-associated beta strand protein
MAINMTGGLLQATNGQLDLGTNANANNVPTVLNTFASANVATLGGVNVMLRQPVTAFTVADGAADPDLLVTAPINEGDVGSGISKDGPGTMKIVTNGTYTGATTINAGKLILNASIAGSAVNVQGGTLTGNGTTGALSVAGGGVVAPGDGVGILNTKNVVMALGSTLSLELNTSTPATGYDQLNVTGTVDVTGATLTLGGSYHGGATNDVFFVLLNDGTDAITGTFNGLAEGSHVLSGTGQDFIITYLADADTSNLTGGNDVALQAVPEPGTMVSLLGGFGLLVGLSRRRKVRR